jgi:hypothetical protein
LDSRKETTLHGEFPILEEMARIYRTLLDLIGQSIGSTGEGREDVSAVAKEAPVASGGESAGEAARRFAAFLAEAAEGEAGASPAAHDRKVPETVSPLGGPGGRNAAIRPSRARSGLEQPFSLTDLPPEKLWHQTLILPPDLWGAGARQVLLWLEETTSVPASAPVAFSAAPLEGR